MFRIRTNAGEPHAIARPRVREQSCGEESPLRTLKALQSRDAFDDEVIARLAEALEDALTIHRLGITGALRKTPITTNPIEPTGSITKQHSARVRSRRQTSMALRWIGAGLVRAEAQCRRVAGYAQMPLLIAALENESLTPSEKLA